MVKYKIGIAKVPDKKDIENTKILEFKNEPIAKPLNILGDAIINKTFGKIKHIIFVEQSMNDFTIELQTEDGKIPLIVVFEKNYNIHEAHVEFELLIGHEGRYLAKNGYIAWF